jgi:hypothetical protein
MSGSWPPEDFPDLNESNHNKTSEATVECNCLSWAADDVSRRWEPDPMHDYYWPPDVPREMKMEAFIQAYRTIGYEVCDTPEPQAGFEKIALYADADNTPTHAAKQLPNGHWSSKLGDFEDIEHATLACLEGPLYGKSKIYMKRRSRPNLFTFPV